MSRVCLALWAFVMLALEMVHAAPGWRWSNPAPHGATIFDITSYGSLAAQICEFGQVFISDDLDEWMPRKTGVTNSLRSAQFFGGRLVITASEGVILYSEGDAMTHFIKANLGTTDWLEGLAVGNGRLVAVGDHGAIYTSSDAVYWERQLDAGEWLTSVAHGATNFVAIGYEGYVTTSNDGLVWSPGVRITTEDLNKIAYLDNRFWILGNNGFVRTSDNGLNWTPITAGTTNDLFGAAIDAQQEVVLVGRSELRTSAPPYTNWNSKISSVPEEPQNWTYYTAHFDGSEFLVAGRSGMFVEGFRTNITAPTIWFNDTNAARNWIWSLTAVDGLFAACGEQGGIFTSLDGFRFDQENVPSSAQSQILEGIGGTTNLLVAVGTQGTILYSEGGYTNVTVTNSSGVVETQQVSLLGLTWESAVSLTSKELQGVGVFGTTYIVTGADGTILTSSDGKLWIPRTSGVSPPRMLSSVTASPTRAVAVGDSGAVTTSDNGTSWSPRNSGVTNWIYHVRYLNGQYVAVGEAGLILTSSNGTTWVRRASPTSVWLNAVAFAGGTYFAVGGSGTILKSGDSISWSQTTPITTKSLYGVAAQAGRVVVAGVEGAILRAPLAPFPTPVDFVRIDRDAAGLVFLFSGELDQTFSLSATPDFQGWVDGTELEIIDNSGILVFFDALGRGDQMFYRTKVVSE